MHVVETGGSMRRRAKLTMKGVVLMVGELARVRSKGCERERGRDNYLFKVHYIFFIFYL